LSRKLKPKPSLPVAKRQPPKWQHERNLVLFVWIAIPLIIVLAVGLVGYWSYDNYVAAWHQPVAKIQFEDGNETTLDMDYFVKMFRLYIIGSQQTTIDTTTFPYELLSELEDDELIKKASPELGIQVTDEEITEEIKGYFTESTTDGGNSTDEGNSTLSEDEIDKLYQQWLDRVRLSDSEYRRVVEATMLREKLAEYFKGQVPTEAEQVHLHAIMVDTTEKASEVRDRLLNGEDFATLAQELSLDEETKPYGGDLGWVPRGILFPEIDDVAFNIEIGNVSEPITTTKGYYVVEVSEKAENMTVDDNHRTILTNNKFIDWVQEQRDASVIAEYLDQDKINWAVDRIK